ncbi:glycosyltransferase [Herpetosiphon sp. NSE202]|uniref:glycosyltransferase n=1 Tax=Herpetosiphon sp. NSE202 TaxID=3351349 RepID=UPI00362EFB1D
MSEIPQIAVVIPALNGEISALRASLARQTWQPSQIEVAVGVRPNGKARNIATVRSNAPYVVFIDDDAVLANDDALEQLVKPLLSDQTIGVTGAAKLLPPDASAFQRWVAREVPRIEHAVVQTPLESNPDPPSFYCELTTTCCAMRRTVYDEVGGFNNELIRGVDTEFFTRVRRAGYRFILVPHTWTWHPAPANLWALLRKHWLYGLGHAQEVRRDPARGRGRVLKTPLHALAYWLLRTLILPINIFLPYSFAAPSWRPSFKPLKALTSYVGALGYIWGWYRA